MLPAGKTGDELPGWIKSIHPNEEMILKDTKNTIEDTVEKIKENVRENKLSCILMIGFVLLFCVLSGPEIAQEAASRHVQSDEVKNPQSESVQPETESEIAQTEETAKETESETEAASAMTPKPVSYTHLALSAAVCGCAILVQNGADLIRDNRYFWLGALVLLLLTAVAGISDTGYREMLLTVGLTDYLENSGAVKDYSDAAGEEPEPEAVYGNTVTPTCPLYPSRGV